MAILRTLCLLIVRMTIGLSNLLADTSTSEFLSVFSYNSKSEETIYKTPEDILPRIPVLNLIPRRFLVDRYTIGQSINAIQVEHRIPTRSASRPQNFWVGMSYAQPMGSDSLSSRIDVPLLSAEYLGAPWARAQMGDYDLHFLNSPVGYSGLRLMANAKFN